jgi:PAS domain S-box-containing protein
VVMHETGLSLADEPVRTPAALAASATAVSMMMTDLGGRIVWVNDAFTQLTGFSAAEALGQSPARLLQPINADPAARAQMAKALGELRSIQTELYNRRKDGSLFWCQVRFDPVLGPDGQTHYMVGTQTDLTESRLTLVELQRRSRLMDDCQAMTQTGAWELDLASGALYWTEGTYRLLELSPGEFQPNEENIYSYIDPVCHERVRTDFEAAKSAGRPINDVMFMHTASGRRIALRAMAAVRIEDGRPTKLYGTLQLLPGAKEPEGTGGSAPAPAPALASTPKLEPKSEPKPDTPR